MTWTTRPRSDVSGLAAIEAGTGPLVVLLHGVGLRAEAWGHQIDALSATHRVLAVDLPGHGESPAPQRYMALADYTDAIAAMLEGPAYVPAYVIGHSMGAMIALDLATRFADRVRGFVALNAIYQRNADALRAVQARAASLDAVTRADPSGTLQRWFGDAASSERDACDEWLRQVDPAAYRMAYHAFASENGPSLDELAAMSCPALFITGSEEPNSTPQMSRAMADLAPHGKALIVDGAAHMMPMTHARAVNVALLDFLQNAAAQNSHERS